jgi:hypothetical protein
VLTPWLAGGEPSVEDGQQFAGDGEEGELGSFVALAPCGVEGVEPRGC